MGLCTASKVSDGQLCFAAFVRILNAMLMAVLISFESGEFSSYASSRKRSNVPRTPLARCAQIESAEIRSSRSAAIRTSCKSACGLVITRRSIPGAGRTHNHQIRRLIDSCAFAGFVSNMCNYKQKRADLRTL